MKSSPVCFRLLARSLLLVVTLILAPVATATPLDSPVSDMIRERVEQIRDGTRIVIGSDAIASALLLPALYERRAYAPVWSNQQSVKQLMASIRQIDEDGLDPDDYHLVTLEKLGQQVSAGNPADTGLRADFDLLLTDSLIRMGYHLSFGKVDPEVLDSNWNMQRYIEDLDAVLELVETIEQGRVNDLVQSLRPQASFYRRLQMALGEYREIRSRGGWLPVPAGETLKPGMSDPRVAAIRTRLAVTGDMHAQHMESTQFDEAVESGVKHFQERHGLTSDGIAGKDTLAAMNVPVETRIDQIRANLERARWVLHDLPDHFILADIAGFNVRYYRNGRIAWETRAQVGKPYRKTPVFKASMTYLDINPTWTVPPTILSKDILPAIKRDPGYLKKKNMRVIDYNGKTIDHASLDWSGYSGSNFPYLIRQDPGPKNALGRIKFMFPNKHLVYLHDTPSRSLFDRTERAFSSGCIRIENPYELAELLLEHDPRWNRESILAAVDSLKTRTIQLDQPVTVILLYWTVAVGEDGQVTFKPDIYNRDAPILAGLASGFSFRSGEIIRDQD